MSRLIKTEPSIVFPFYQGDNILNALSKRITCSRSEADKVATRVNAKGLIEQVDANQLRLDYDPVTRQCLGLLVEPSATNLLTYSQDFSHSSWDLGGGTINTNSSVAPDGTLTATTYTSQTSNGYVAKNVSVSANTFYTFSVWLRVSSGTHDINLQFTDTSFQNGGGGIVTLTTQWQRFTATGSITNTNGRVTIGEANTLPSGTQIEVWGAQLEEGSVPTSYIKTTDAAVTRNADIVTYEGQGFQSAYNQNEGTWIVEVSGLKDGIAQGILAPVKADDELGTRTGAMLKDMNNNIDMAFGGIYVNDVIQSSEYNLNSLNKFGIRYAKTGVSAYSNGSLVYNSALQPSLLIDKLKIGAWINNMFFLNGHIYSLVYYPVALTDEQIQSRTKLSTL